MKRLISLGHSLIRRRVPLLLFVLCAGSCVSQSNSVSQWQMITGTWVLTAIYQTSNVEGPSPSEQKKLLGTNIVLNAGSLKACGQSVLVKSVEATQVSSDTFLFDTHARFAEVGINAPEITEIIINGNKSGTCFGAFSLPGQDIYIKNKDELLIDFAGVFYRALRKK